MSFGHEFSQKAQEDNTPARDDDDEPLHGGGQHALHHVCKASGVLLI